MEQLMGKLNQFEDMIRKNERAKQVIEMEKAIYGGTDHE